MTVQVKLYGGKARRYVAIKERAARDLGYEPTNPELVGLMMAEFDAAESIP